MEQPPFDPREQRVRGPQEAAPCSTESARRAWDEMHQTRAGIILDVAQTDIKTALRILLDLYPGTDTHRAVLLYATLSDEHGPATVYRHLVDVLVERVR